MISMENGKQHNSPIPEEIFRAFTDACYNLAQYGELARAGLKPTFHRLTVKNNLIMVNEVEPRNRPTHMSRGSIYLPPVKVDETKNTIYGTQRVYEPIERPSEPVTVDKDEIVMATVLSTEYNIGRKTTPNAVYLTDDITTVDDRLFHISSRPPYQRAEKVTEYDATQTSEAIRDNLLLRLNLLAEAYSKVQTRRSST